jgi:eukaryotic-like serine/threonine-protein kinase
MSLQLVVIAGPDTDRTFTIQPGAELFLGRSERSYYRLTDPRASRVHCQVLLEGETPWVICNGGSGGTLVNGKVVTRHALALGDVLQVGDTQLRLHMGDFPLDIALGAVKAAGAGLPGLTPEASPAQLDQIAALSGQTLGHYDIVPEIGRGRSCVVFHASDTKDNRSVALKVLQPEFSADEEEMQRFIRAMKTILPLNHPNLIRLHAAGKTASFCWVAMEYVAGENLQQVIDRIGVAGMLDWRHGFKVATHVARALEYGHDHAILHRNVTPTNILLEATSKTAKLGDLMLAKALEGVLAKQITRPGEIVGDVGYMSPERTRGTADLDGRSDLYGLGATVYALLTARPPFTGTTLVEKITKIRQSDPEKPTKFQMSIPARFEQVVLKLLAKDPDDRYQSATDLLKELDRVGKLSGVTV